MKILDLFSGAGGAGVGYSRAGFDVGGVDIDPQPDYPFEHHVMDWQEALDTLDLTEFDAIHASPPCQGYTALAAVHGNTWPKLIEPVRTRLDAIGLPYVIENVQGAPVRRDLTLCGEMFGLRVIRHRYFELGGWVMDAPHTCPTAAVSRATGMAHGSRDRTSRSTATAAARALCGTGSWLWASTGCTTSTTWLRRSRRRTRATSVWGCSSTLPYQHGQVHRKVQTHEEEAPA